MSRLDEIKARTEQVQHWTSTTSIEQAMARLASSAADVPWLISEVERLERWKAEALEVMSGLQELGKALGLGLGVQITGPAALAEVARLTAERDALAAQVARAEKLAGQWERVAATAINPDSREWLQACAETLRECLSGWPKMRAALAAPTETDDLERCDCGRVVPCRHCDPTGQEDSPDAGQGALTTIRNLLDDAGHSRVSIQGGKLDNAEAMLAAIAQANHFARMGTSPRTHVLIEKWNDQADMEPERTVAALVALPRDLLHENVGLVIITRSRKVASSLAAKAGTNVIEFMLD